MRFLVVVSALIFLQSSFSFAQLSFTVESGAAFNGYNDVRFPNDDGSAADYFSLTDDFNENKAVLYSRIEARYQFFDRNVIELTAAPLAFNYVKLNRNPIEVGTNTYGLSGDEVKARYEFNTYRLSYRYTFLDAEKWHIGAGASILLRDARISLEENTLSVETTDLGVVPLISFTIRYHYNAQLDLLLKGDALVGPVGRAEDLLLGAEYSFKQSAFSVRAGYRIIEGGADVSQVYNFSLIHFTAIGLCYQL